jgi:tetratricopeptide (TPR) repeat protein
MFTFMRRFAWFRKDDSPRGQALRALEHGRLDEAEAQLSALLGGPLTPVERSQLLNKRGVARVLSGRRDDARADFCAALDALPRYAPALTNIGNLLLEEGKLDDAIEQYQGAIRADDEYALAHRNLGVAYRKCGRLGDSVRELRRAQRLEGGFFRKRVRGSRLI